MAKKIRTHTVGVRLRDDERMLVEAAAARDGKTAGAYMRHCSLLNALWAMEEDPTGVKLSKELQALKEGRSDVFEAVREFVRQRRLKKAS